MKIIAFTDKNWSCVKLWFSRAFPNSLGIPYPTSKKSAEIMVSKVNAGDVDDLTFEDIDTLSKIEAFYHASETNDPDNNTSFKEFED